MKLFLREHHALVALQCIQFVVILGVYWLAGFRDWKLVMYSFFLGIVLFVIYMAYYFWTRRGFFRRLSKPYQTTDEVLEEVEKAPISEALQKLNLSHYRLYQNEMMTQAKKQEDYAKFMDLWVHQMKTPISVIDLTAREVEEPYSSNIRYENDKLKTGLNDVLHMARLREVQKDFHVKRVNVIDTLKMVNKENRRLFIRNHIYPDLQVADEAIYVETDEKWLYFIFTQLIQNAVKYSTGYAETILMTVKAIDQAVVCTIQDFGIGIPQEDLKRIFDPFYTGINGRKYRESTGIGLYIVQEVAQYLGHQIEVTSKVGESTSFSIIFKS